VPSMPLPDGDQPWPPKHLAPVYSQIATWAAWYSGDPEALAAIYGGSQGYDSTGFFASERGGWRGAVGRAIERWFWGTRLSQGEQRTKLHLPAASDIASTSADLLFSEAPTLTVEDKATQARLAELAGDGMQAALLEAAEIAAGLGSVYLRTVWDTEARPDGPWLTGVHPDAVVPEWSWGELAAATLWRVLRDDGRTVVRHLERHNPGRITHGVYEGTPEKLGRPAPLTEYPETASIDGLSDGNVVETGVPKLLIEYVPNIKPNRLWRNVPTAAPFGRADIAGTEPLMDALDEAWTSWMRDLRLAKARLVVPRAYLQSNGPGRGAGFDVDKELYEALDMLPGDDTGAQITLVQFAIRVEEHAKTVEALWSSIVRACGYSVQTFGELGDAGAGVTATEIRARQRRSFMTAGKKVRYWRPRLASSIETLLMVDAAVFGSRITPVRPQVEFGDSIAEDPRTTAETLSLLETARAISTEMKVRAQHPDWEGPEVAAEVARIKAEQAMSELTDPATFRGNPPADPAEE